MLKLPCNFDHNGECLICDCFPEHCAWKRFLNEDYRWENKDQLLLIFKNWIRQQNLSNILDEKKNI